LKVPSLNGIVSLLLFIDCLRTSSLAAGFGNFEIDLGSFGLYMRGFG